MASQPLCIEGCTQRYEPLQVIPFGNLRVKASLPLSEAYRSLARPSSPAGAKAFTMCSKILDACSRWLAPASNKILSFSLLICLVQFSKNLSGSTASTNYTLMVHQMVGLNGLEPLTPALSRRCSNQLSYRPGFHRSPRFKSSQLSHGGGMGTRTPDIQLAKLALYQLSYTPFGDACVLSQAKAKSCTTREVTHANI